MIVMKAQELNTIENNKLIAQFMGYEYKKIKDIEAYSIPFKSGIWVVPELLAFHSSWDWLMPVVEKVSNICGFHNIERDLTDIKITAKIEDVYSAVIGFIKSYNEKNHVSDKS